VQTSIHFSHTAKGPIDSLPLEARSTRESLKGVRRVDEELCLIPAPFAAPFRCGQWGDVMIT